MVKKLHLILTHHKAVNQMAVRKWQETPLRAWPSFFLEDRIAQGDAYISFPTLEVLLLDFGDWELGIDDTLVVSLHSHLSTI